MTMRFRSGILCGALLLIAAVAQGWASSIPLVDPSFESANDAAWNAAVAGSTSASGFPISTPPNGTRFMLLVGYPGAPAIPSISQGVGAAVPGATYSLSFYSAPRSDSSPGNIGHYPRLSALQFTASIVLRNGNVDTPIASTVVNPDLYSPGSWVQTTLFGTVPANAAGNIVLKFIGSGFRGNDNQQTGIDMVVLDGPPPPVNQPPVLTVPGPQTVTEGSTLSFDVSATDDGGPAGLTYSATGLPAGASLGLTTGAFTWTPKLGQAGSYTVNFTAADNGSPPKSNGPKPMTITVKPITCVPPTSGLVSWWPGEGNANDIVDSNNGNANAVTYVPGKVGQAFSFNGTDSYVQVPANANLPSGSSPRTVAMWVYTRPSSWAVDQNTIFHSGLPNSDRSFSLDMDNYPNMQFYSWPGEILFNAGVPQEGWVHIAVTYDGGTVRVYTQGQQRGALSVALHTAANGLDIGRVPPTIVGNSYFDGLIDGFAVFNRALTASEIQDLAHPLKITLNGNSPMTLECPAAYTEPGATLTDNCDPSPTLTVSGTVDTHTPGSYTITYNATDSEGNTATATRAVVVKDTTPPVIAMDGDNPITLECPAAYVEPGAKVTDTCDPKPSLTITGTVDSHTPGSYKITYTSKDASGNAATAVVRTVEVKDTKPPVITLKGINPATVECHTPYTDAGATADDACDGPVAVTSTSTVDANAVGTYTVTYTAKDASGNEATAKRTVTVVDTKPPVITLKGINPATVECHTSYTDAGATADDACDGPVAVTSASTVDANAVGTYAVTYTAKDASGNEATAKRTVEVKDTKPPVITLNGDNPVTLECPAPYKEPGATAKDDCDANPSLEITGTVDSHTPGSYKITYTATDASGNESTATRTVKVQDTKPPVITLNGDNPITLECPAPYKEPGATAKDDCDANPSLEITGTVDSHTPGSYKITYTATDASQNSSTATRTVVVQDTKPPVITLKGINPSTVECHTSYTDAGATAEDACDGPVTVTSASTVDANAVGTYAVTYTAKDASGNEATAKRTVTVVDTTPPVVTLNGSNPIILECPAGYVEPGAKVTDTCDPAPKLEITGTVDSHAPGSYTITYSATDASGNKTTILRTVKMQDTTPPAVKASLTWAKILDKDKEDDGKADGEDYTGNAYKVSVLASDTCDRNPAITSFIPEPLTAASVISVKYEKGQKNSIGIHQEDKKIEVKLQGPNEQALRALLTQALQLTGFRVTDGQVVSLVSKPSEDKGKGEYLYRFDGSLNLTSATGPGIKLVAFAVDASGNRSTVVEVLSAKPKSNKGQALLAKVGEETAPAAPEAFGVDQNFPNPFNPSTTIQYALPEGSNVRLVIYNILGQSVRTLVDASQSAGRYSVVWDGRDAAGRQAASGLYIYRLQAGSFVATQKMLLAK